MGYLRSMFCYEDLSDKKVFSSHFSFEEVCSLVANGANYRTAELYPNLTP